MKRTLYPFLALLIFLAACSTPNTPEASTPETNNLIPGRYIVMLADDGLNSLSYEAQGSAIEASAAELGLQAVMTLRVINGFVAEGVSEATAAALAADPRVAHIEQDQIMSINVTQSNATWGLDRIDQRNLPLNGTYIYYADGSGVNAYILDTGIRAHSEFGSRLRGGVTAISDGNGSSDCNGHGTHVAGTVGGSVYGVAKNINLYAVRVLDCAGSGSNSGIISGVDWVRTNHIKPAVANMSLGGGISSALDTAVNNAINAGVTVVVAAGNENQNACNVSPARVTNAITVGSTTSSDARSSFSNFGSCVNIFAPGSNITAAWHTSSTALNTISGTSMASPHVAGTAALYLQNNRTASPATVRSAIYNNGTTGKVTGAGTGSPNLLLYNPW